MTRLKALNIFVLQWFFVRLARIIDDDMKQVGWGLLGPVLPLTGWRSDYIGRTHIFVRWGCV